MYETIVRDLISKADELTAKGSFEDSLSILREAVALVPDPFEDQPEAIELLAAIGDNYYFIGDFEKVQKAYSDIMQLGDSPANPYIRVRRCQIALELGDTKRGGTELACAYMNGGKEIFQDEDPKYLEVVKKLIPKEFEG